MYSNCMHIQASMKLGPEDMSLIEKCPCFRGCYVQASVLENVPLLERCPHFMYMYTYIHTGVRTWRSH